MNQVHSKLKVHIALKTKQTHTDKYTHTCLQTQYTQGAIIDTHKHINTYLQVASSAHTNRKKNMHQRS